MTLTKKLTGLTAVVLLVGACATGVGLRTQQAVADGRDENAAVSSPGGASRDRADPVDRICAVLRDRHCYRDRANGWALWAERVEGRRLIGVLYLGYDKGLDGVDVVAECQEAELAAGQPGTIVLRLYHGGITSSDRTHAWFDKRQCPLNVSPDPEPDERARVREQHTGSLLFGQGVNSDAGLTGSIVTNERNFDTSAPPGTAAGVAGLQAEKDYQIAEFYRRTGHPGSAFFYYEIVRRRYPGSKYSDLATERLKDLRAGASDPTGAPVAPPADAGPAESEAERVLRLAFGGDDEGVNRASIRLALVSRGIYLAARECRIERDGRVRLVPGRLVLLPAAGQPGDATVLRAPEILLTCDGPVAGVADLGRRKITAAECLGGGRMTFLPGR